MIKKFFKGFGFAFNGLSYAFSTQINFKFHVFSAIAVAALGYYAGLSLNEWCWIAAAVFIVLIAELFNTAIEILVDLVSPEYNPKAGLVKDISAAAVLLSSLMAAIIGLMIFIPKFF